MNIIIHIKMKDDCKMARFIELVAVRTDKSTPFEPILFNVDRIVQVKASLKDIQYSEIEYFEGIYYRYIVCESYDKLKERLLIC